MQYLVSVIDDKTNSGTPDEMAAINAFNDRLEAEGHWVFAGGLSSPSSATVIDNRDGPAVFTDGPFLESKGRRPAIGSSRCGRSWAERDPRPGGDHSGPPRGVGAGGRLPDQAFR